MTRCGTTFACAMALAVGASAAQAQDAKMSFFITSVGVGDGANLGGIEGADAHCQKLAQATPAGNKTWRAYLSTATPGSTSRRG